MALEFLIDEVLHLIEEAPVCVPAVAVVIGMLMAAVVRSPPATP